MSFVGVVIRLYMTISGKILGEECERKNINCEINPNCTPNPNCGSEPLLVEQFMLDNKATYYQFTVEVQYTPTSEFNIISQYTNYDLISIGNPDTLFNSQDGPTALYPDSLFIPSMGSPNTFISTNSFSISAQKIFSDIGLELRLTSMFDLDEKGSFHEAGIEYEIYKNTKILLAANKIIADKSIKMNSFSGMEDFSHIRMELKYYY